MSTSSYSRNEYEKLVSDFIDYQNYAGGDGFNAPDPIQQLNHEKNVKAFQSLKTGGSATGGKRLSEMLSSVTTGRISLKDMRFGYVPSLLIILVTFGLSCASAVTVADALGFALLKPLFIAGFTASEFIIFAWFFEPDIGAYNKGQLRALDFGAWYILGAGLLDGILMIMTNNMEGDTMFMIYIQALIGLSIVFVAGGVSKYLKTHSTKRLVNTEKTDVIKNTEIAWAKLEAQRENAKIAAYNMEIKHLEKTRKDLSNEVTKALNTQEAQTIIKQHANKFAELMVDQMGHLVNNTIAEHGLLMGKPGAA